MKMISVGIEEIRNRYFEKTKRSRELNVKAANFLPGGDTRTSVFFEPYPPYMVRGKGCQIFDADGNQYLDYMNNYTTLIHGHDHPKIREAVVKQLEHGTIFGAPHLTQCELAEVLCSRVPSIKKIRFCNSGTEGTMFAIRAAMAFTGRNKVIKIEGGYHGTHDIVEASVSPSLGEVGEIDSPKTVPNCLGIPTNVFDNVVIAPFNDQERMRKVVQTHKNDLAAIIVEPILGVAGVIPANKDYLVFLRELTRETGSLLIFDEIVSFRVAPGGAQEYYGVIPDLTVLGKIIGGGLPVGAFGGREDVMELFSPQKGRVPHAGTFNGHPLAMVAGLVAMQEMTTEVYAKINSLGDSLRRGITNVFHELDIKAKAGGVGSLIYLHYTLDEITNYRDARKAREKAKMLPDLVNLCLLNHGIFIASRGQLALSTPMTDDDIRQTVQSFYDSFEELKPFISQFLPNLISG